MITTEEQRDFLLKSIQLIVDQAVYGACRTCSCLTCMGLRMGDQMGRKMVDRDGMDPEVLFRTFARWLK